MPHGGLEARPGELLDQHRLDIGQAVEVGVLGAGDELGQRGRILGQDLALEHRLQPLLALGEDVLDVVVGRVLEHVIGDLQGLLGPVGRLVEAQRADAVHAHAHVGIVDGGPEQGQGVGHLVLPVAEDAGGGGARARLGRLQHGLEQADVDDAVPLQGPQGLEAVVLVFGIGLVKTGEVLLRRGGDGGARVLGDLDLGALTRAVLPDLENVKQLVQGLAMDAHRLKQRPALVGQLVDAAVAVVAVRVAQVVLHVPDDGVGPVAEVEGAVGADADAGGAEGRVHRRIGLDHLRLRLALHAGAVLQQRHAPDALETDDVGVEEVVLPVLGKVAAADDVVARAGARGALPELLEFGAAAAFHRQVAGRGLGKGVHVAGGVGEVGVAPAVPDFAVRIDCGVGGEPLQAMGVEVVAVDGAVGVAHRTIQGLDLGAVEHAVARVDRAAVVVAQVAGLVMAVRRAQAGEDALALVRLAVAVGVGEVEEAGRLHDDDAVLVDLEPGRAVQIVDEFGHFVGAAVAVGVFKNEQAVALLAGGGALGVVEPGGHPQAAAGVPGHLHRIHQFGELLLVGEQGEFEPGLDLDVLHRLLRVREGDQAVGRELHAGHRHLVELLALLGVRHVRRHLFHRRQVVVLHLEIATARHGPDAPVAVGGLDVALRHLLLHHLVVGKVGFGRIFLVLLEPSDARLIGEPAAAAVDVVAVDRPVPLEPLPVLGHHRLAQLGGDFGRRPARQRPVGRRGDHLVAEVVLQQAVEGERLLAGLVGLAGRFEQVHKADTGSRGHLAHGGGVVLQVGVPLLRRRQAGIVQLLQGDRREQHDARGALAAVVLLLRPFDELGEVRLEGLQPLVALEGFVVAVKGENHVRPDLGQPFVARAEVVDAVPGLHLVARKGQVAEGQVRLGMRLGDHRLQPAVVLRTVGHAAAENGDAVALLEFDLGGHGGGKAKAGGEEKEQAGFHGDATDGRGIRSADRILSNHHPGRVTETGQNLRQKNAAPPATGDAAVSRRLTSAAW